MTAAEQAERLARYSAALKVVASVGVTTEQALKAVPNIVAAVRNAQPAEPTR